MKREREGVRGVEQRREGETERGREREKGEGRDKGYRMRGEKRELQRK